MAHLKMLPAYTYVASAVCASTDHDVSSVRSWLVGRGSDYVGEAHPSVTPWTTAATSWAISFETGIGLYYCCLQPFLLRVVTP